jgi:hypothetical protein
METLNLLKQFSSEHNKPINKNYVLNDAKKEMYYIQEILKMQNLFNTLPYDNEEIPEIKEIILINIRYLYIDSYKHLTTDKQLLTGIKKETLTIIKRYSKYFYKLKYIKYETPTEELINI